jgi:ribonuclease III
VDVEQDALSRCQDLVDYRFQDESLLALALTHASIAPTRILSNERLEFLGDAVLGLVVCSWLYDNREDLLEGEMTKAKSLVVSRQICATIADEIGLSDLLFLGKGMGGPNGLPTSVAAGVFESIIAAVYLDGGLEAAREFILRHVRPQLEEALEDSHQQNYKSMLQQSAQRGWGTTPDYRLLDEKGPDHSKCFEVSVVIDGRNYPSAWGTTKKEAEQEAARRALQELGLIEEDQPD